MVLARVMKTHPETGERKEDDNTSENDGVVEFLEAVQHAAAVRRMSVEQLSFRNRMLQADSPAVIARKHIIEKYTHKHLVAKLLVIASLSVVLVIVSKACSAAASRDFVKSDIGSLMSVLGVLMICS